MAVNSIISKISDLNEPLYQEELPNILVTGDQNGDRFDITVVRGSEKVNVASAGVTGYFIRIKSGTKIEDAPTVVITGSASDNIVSVTLPESCYVDSGRFSLVIKAAIGNERHAVYACSGVILRSSTNEIIDPGHEIPDLDELLAMISQVESAASAAQAAAQQATSAAGSANTAAGAANAAAEAANRAKGEADTAAANANAAAGTANASAAAADEATGQANAAANAANTAAEAATTATGQANEAAANANARADYLANATFSAHTVAPGGSATVIETDENGHAHFDFGLVKGDTGDGDVSSVWGARPDETGDARPEIGGTNLLLGTGTVFQNSGYYIGSYAYSDNARTLKDGENLTLSGEVTLGAGKTHVRFFSDFGQTYLLDIRPNDIQDGKFSKTFSWNKGKPDYNDTGMFIYVYPNEEISAESKIGNLKLERGSIPTNWSPAPEDKQDKIDIIGGRNLLPARFSGGEKVSEYLGLTVCRITQYGEFQEDFAYYGIPKNFKPDTDYVFSFYAKGTVPKIRTFWYPDAVVPVMDGRSDGGFDTEITTDWKRYFIQYHTLPSYSNTDDKSIIACRIGPEIKSQHGQYAEICGIKLEEGVIPTDWSPAPEDHSNELENLKTQLRALGINVT